MNKIVDPLEQLLIDIKTGVEHLESRPAPNQATDYRGQMRDMTAEISNLSLMVKGLGEGISKIPSHPFATAFMEITEGSLGGQQRFVLSWCC